MPDADGEVEGAEVSIRVGWKRLIRVGAAQFCETVPEFQARRLIADGEKTSRLSRGISVRGFHVRDRLCDGKVPAVPGNTFRIQHHLPLVALTT
jgi:hypothetical protein